jgi:glyoxylase-like metal-dependent hydrolase (beta-lactamase superfamily II)
MAAQWDVYVLEFAMVPNDRWVNLVSGYDPDATMDLPFSFILARNGERNILVDTGFLQDDGSDYAIKLGIPRWISPLRMLAEAGLRPAEVTDIVITHAHFDHMGSIGEFPNATIHIQKRELLSWYEAFALPRQFGNFTRLIDPDNMRQALEASIEHRVNLIDGDRDNVLPGLHVRFGSGHTMGQQFVILESARGRLVISGDCLYTSVQLTGHNHDGMYVPLNNAFGSVLDQLRTLDKVNDELAGDLSRLIILHDTERWKDLPVIREIEGFRIVKAS